ncbi:DUF6288 domain-containing protein [Akkermansiaceae bacterium]|nr:DUF6288 domain-containing protein [Akkermansiaceae bacterium]
MFKYGVLSFSLIALSLGYTYAQKPSFATSQIDFTKGGKLPSLLSHDWTLGATGLRGWCQVSKGYGEAGTTKDARQIYITMVESGSPAQGKLKKGDIITGIGEVKFEQDARVSLAKALEESENKGSIQFLVFSKGKEKLVELELEKYPMYANTSPFGCEKSQILLSQGCDQIIESGLKRRDIGGYVNALTLLASGKKEYLPEVKTYISGILSAPLNAKLALGNWSYAMCNILLTEYYLVSNDQSVLPEIDRLTQIIVGGQGFLGTWGHIPKNEVTKRLNGYGAVNAVGLQLSISLVLARECGSKVEGLDEAISKSANFFRRHVGLGAIPYGDGPPQTGGEHDDNGKNSAAAIFYSLLGEDDAVAYYAKSALATYDSSRERGHAGNLTSIFWGLPAVSLLGEEATGAWMEKFSWYYDLSRKQDHSYSYQGYPNEKSKSGYSRFDCTGAYTLHYALPLKKLRITGRGVNEIEKFTSDEVKEIVAIQGYDYSEYNDKKLVNLLTSWSAIVRKKASNELKKRNITQRPPLSYAKGSDAQKIAYVHLCRDFDAITPFLADASQVVQFEAMNALVDENKNKAFGALFEYFSKTDDEKLNPVLVQHFIDKYFNFGTSSVKAGGLLNSVKDRKVAIEVIEKILNHEDCYVASRVAVGVSKLKKNEIEELAPVIFEKAKLAPAGNVMFGNITRISCARVLADLNLEEGLESAIEILQDESWGRGVRYKQGLPIVLGYEGHAKEYIPQLESILATQKEGSDSYNLFVSAIKKIKGMPDAKTPLKTIQDL